MPGPLDGIRILDFTRFQQGTYGVLLLADLGADVLKVEQPTGDPGRGLGRHQDGYSSYFESLNRNKRSLCLDLTKPEGREVILRIVPGVEVVAENFRPGTMEKLGIGYDVLSKLNPGLVFGSASMFGPNGPRGFDPGYDTIAQAAGGLMAFHTRDGDTPTGAQGGIADQTGGQMLAYSILAALVHKLRTGEGQKTDSSLYGAQIGLQGIHVARMLHHTPLRPPGQSSGVVSHRAQCLDGRWIAFGILEGRQFDKICKGLGLEHLLDDPRFATPAARGPHIGELVELMDARVITRPADEWIERLRAADLPCSIVQDYEMIANDPQARANGYIHEEEHPVYGHIRTQGPVAQFSKTPASVRRHAPIKPGDHSAEILRESGFSDDEIATLAAKGVVLGAGLPATAAAD